MAKPFLGVGLKFPLEWNKAGNFQQAYYEETVHQSIWVILSTAKGERVMRPEFGCGIYDLVFEPYADSTLGKISLAVQEALLQFEPRIDVLEVQIDPDSDPATGLLLIRIEYQVRATNNVFNLVYPFYLERSAF
ncbi:GPW/gp25 family protein [Leptolyngbya sp. 7M]|uniref:GPW/gp25 family protein n=1 Tax=Leptolyngbya sp. 7M TaxID=2812896 RepID=UPI001B8ACF7C|nr:GPW/gp25 family protein [Leptolyngbya sp. 7M]QYO62086.1 GPW/gp25 family protein [Leptolyngbya sp. 7M]